MISDLPRLEPVSFPAGISVFFPAFNDAPSLPSLIQRTMDTLRAVSRDYEVIVVNDGSTDATAEVLRDLERQYQPFLRLITHEQNRGYGAALRTGLAAATKEFIFYTDGDGQYDPGELPRLLAAMTPETGLVNGYKIERNDPRHRIWIGNVYNRFARLMFGISLRDIDCDFRLIRRSALDLSHLRATGGTICIEIVRSLELSGTGVVELPVHHYPRLHGHSQFFRIPALASTFWQLCALFFRLVVIPEIDGRTTPPTRGNTQPARLPGWAIFLSIFAAVTALSLLTYGRALTLPFIADDYIQIQIARDYGSVSTWPALFADALYRCRATSLVMTYWTENVFGLNPLAFRLSSLALHIVNCLLVFALGAWRPIGCKISAIAACFFALSQRHSEAVIWYAALPELLVFLFSVGSFLCWVRWLQGGKRSWGWYGMALALFGLALFSKESAVAVAPLCALAAGLQPERRRDLWWTLPFFVGGAAYFAMTFGARDTHLHFNDGTFSLGAPFWSVIARSAAGLLWVWGLIALGVFAVFRPKRWRTLLLISAAWMVITLLPYSFLTHMPRVPSRHTYLASVGLSFIVAAMIASLWLWSARRNQIWIAAVLTTVIVLHESTYVSIVKHAQYLDRAAPTESLLRVARQSAGPVYAKCFPYSRYIGEYALKVTGQNAVFRIGPEAKAQPTAIDFCNGRIHE